MNSKRFAVMLILTFIFFMGCSGNYAKIKTESKTDSKATQQELIDNFSDYNIWVNYSRAPELNIIVFDPKNDDREILVGSNWSKVKDQEMWTEILKANFTSDGDSRQMNAYYDWPSGVEELWGPDNEFYGFIIYQTSTVDSIYLELADEKTIRVSWYRRRGRGNPVFVR